MRALIGFGVVVVVSAFLLLWTAGPIVRATLEYWQQTTQAQQGSINPAPAPTAAEEAPLSGCGW